MPTPDLILVKSPLTLPAVGKSESLFGFAGEQTELLPEPFQVLGNR